MKHFYWDVFSFLLWLVFLDGESLIWFLAECDLWWECTDWDEMIFLRLAAFRTLKTIIQRFMGESFWSWNWRKLFFFSKFGKDRKLNANGLAKIPEKSPKSWRILLNTKFLNGAFITGLISLNNPREVVGSPKWNKWIFNIICFFFIIFEQNLWEG